MLDIELNESLYPRRDELQAKLDGISNSQASDVPLEDLDIRQAELAALVRSIAFLVKRLSSRPSLFTQFLNSVN